MFQRILPLTVIVLLTALPATGQERRIILSAPAELEESGLLKYLLPRFSLKTSIRISVLESDGTTADPLAVDVVLTAAEKTELAGERRAARPVFADADGDVFGLLLTRSTEADLRAEFAARFADWLVSETGLRTLESFRVDDVQLYTASLPEAVEEVPAPPTGDIVLGEALSLKHCGRCHVVSVQNRMKGLGSTPSFRALKALPDWDYRFQVFYVLNPHPAFTQIADVTEPFDPMRPSPIAPVEMTSSDMEAILAFVATLEPADLGAPVQAN